MAGVDADVVVAGGGLVGAAAALALAGLGRRVALIDRAEPQRTVGRLGFDQLADVRNRQIGFVFQSFNLIPRTSALENAQLPLFYRRLPLAEQRAKAAAALQRVGLEGREQHFPTQLSGGQQQRVAIARALIGTPSLLLADEPTGNLDTQSSREIMSVLQTLNREGITIILVTHEADIAAYAQREILLKDGQVLSDRATKQAPGAVEV